MYWRGGVDLSAQCISMSCALWLFPTCQVRIVRFFQRCLVLLLLLLLLPPLSLLALHRSGHHRTSTASSWSHWSSPDLNCQLPIAVGTAGPQQPEARLVLHSWGIALKNRSVSKFTLPCVGVDVLPAHVGGLWSLTSVGPLFKSVHLWLSS